MWEPQALESPNFEDILKSARYSDGQLEHTGASNSVPPPPTTLEDIQSYDSPGNRLYLHRFETALCRRLDVAFELLSRQLEDKMNRAIEIMLGNMAEHGIRLRALEAAMARRHDRELADLKTTIERLSREHHEGEACRWERRTEDSVVAKIGDVELFDRHALRRNSRK
jgi:hypothetical protein